MLSKRRKNPYLRVAWVATLGLGLGCASSEKMAWDYDSARGRGGPQASTPPPNYSWAQPEVITLGPPAPANEGLPLSDDPWGEATEPPVILQPATFLKLQWPLTTPGVTSLFGERVDPMTGTRRFHYGIDMEGELGQTVEAAAPGRVVWAQRNGGHGLQVILEHAGNYRTSYSHLDRILVSVGTQVGAGQTIGQVGSTGRSTGPHLHFELTREGAYLDPIDVLGMHVPLE